MADETQLSPDPVDHQAEPAANPGGGDPLAALDTLFEPRAEPSPSPSTVEAEPDAPAGEDTPADSGDEPSTPGDDPQAPQPSRRESSRERDARLLDEARQKGVEEERSRVAAEQRAAELDRQLADLKAKQDEAIQRGLQQIGTDEERAQLYRTLRTADPYTDEYDQAKTRLDEMDRHAEVFSIHEQVVHRAVMGSAYHALYETALANGIDPRTIDPNDTKVTIGEHVRRIVQGVTKARDAHWQARVADLEAQLETDRAKLAGHAAELPTGGRSARSQRGSSTFEPTRSPQENLDAAVAAFAGSARR